jgi:2-dehydro-3-deoxyphosphogluconate aldolase/(4S)-4-hydroxy-2-oxoglutarate aldolase
MRQILARVPVMPVLTVNDVNHAAELAVALVQGGVFVFEVLLRTPQALDAVKAMIDAAPEADIGLGTLLTAEDVQAAVEAGVAFGVSPGLTPSLASAV